MKNTGNLFLGLFLATVTAAFAQDNISPRRKQAIELNQCQTPCQTHQLCKSLKKKKPIPEIARITPSLLKYAAVICRLGVKFNSIKSNARARKIADAKLV
jgi:hypothetical protein